MNKAEKEPGKPEESRIEAEAGTQPTPDEAEVLPETLSDEAEVPPETLSEALEQIQTLREKLSDSREEAVANQDLFYRERAEAENFKRRLLREKNEALRFATQPLLHDLLGSLDNLERALSAAESSGEATVALHQGVGMVLDQLRTTLERHGVTRIEAADRPFDPAEHEAIAQIPTTRTTPGQVLDEHQPGYRLHDRLLRAAQVTVAQAPTPETEKK